MGKKGKMNREDAELQLKPWRMRSSIVD